MGIPTAPPATDRPGLLVRFATCGPLGYFPLGPGSLGAGVGLLLVVAIGRLALTTPQVSLLVAAVAVLIAVVGIAGATEAERYFGRRDPGNVVIDEVVGQMITLLLAPRSSWKGLLAAYFLFRFFDVLKPFPARRLEHLRGGWGIMLDDVAAGGWALAVFTGLGHWLK